MKLYPLPAVDERLIQDNTNEETGEVNPIAIAALRAREEGGRAVVAHILNLRAEVAGADYTLKRVQARKRALEAAIAYWESGLGEWMRETSTREIVGRDNDFRARLYLDRDERVEIADGVMLPPNLQRVKTVIEPDKVKIKAAIEAGEPVPEGVRIVRKDRLVIS